MPRVQAASLSPNEHHERKAPLPVSRVHVVLVASDERGHLMRTQDLDTYARVILERTLHATRYRDATVPELERMRLAYMQLHRDTPALCAQRRKAI